MLFNLQEFLTAISKSGYLKIDGTDLKHWTIEALLTGSLAGLGVYGMHLANQDVGTLGPALVWGLAMLGNLLKKALTDNTTK